MVRHLLSSLALQSTQAHKLGEVVLVAHYVSIVAVLLALITYQIYLGPAVQIFAQDRLHNNAFSGPAPLLVAGRAGS